MKNIGSAKSMDSKMAENSTNLPVIEGYRYYDFDDLLPLLGNFSFYQIPLFLLMIPFCIIAATLYLSQIFLLMQPKSYYCFVFELHPISTEERRMALSIPKEADGSYSRCLMYDINYTEIRFSSSHDTETNSSFPTIPCNDGYVFDKKINRFFSATMEFGWLCGKKNYTIYPHLSFFVGSMLGFLFFHYFAKNCGRRAALISCTFWAMLSGFCSTLSNCISVFCISRFMAGLTHDIGFSLIYTLLLEYVGPKYRPSLAYLSLALFYVPVGCLLPWIALWIGTWRKFIGMLAFPGIISLVVYCIIPPSSRWLVSTGRLDFALSVLTRIARRNNKTDLFFILEQFRNSCILFHKEELAHKKLKFLNAFSGRLLSIRIIILVILWICVSVVYDAHIRIACLISDDPFTTFSISYALEIPGFLLIMLFIDHCGRRLFALTSCSFCGFCCLLSALRREDLMIIFCLAGRFFASIIYHIGLMWGAEMLPTDVRPQCMSFIQMFGLISIIVNAPLTNLQKEYLPQLLLILSGLSFLAAILTLFLPETLHTDLPQIVEEGNWFAEDQRPWDIPGCASYEKSLYRSKYTWHTGSSLRSINRDEMRSKQMHRLITPSLRSSSS